MGNVVKLPQELTSNNIPSACVACWPVARRLLHADTSDNDVLIDRRRGAHADWRREAIRHSLLEIDDPVVPEPVRWLASLCVQRDQRAGGSPEHDARS